MKDVWNLDVIYKGFDDPAFAADMEALDAKTREAFLTGMRRTVRQLDKHPCVVGWTIFNEGWGQFDADAAYRRLRALDDSRIIDTASGWFRPKKSDFESEHIYFKPIKLKSKLKAPLFLSEFGGYSYKISDHSFNLSKTYGYKKFDEQKSFVLAMQNLYENEVLPAVKNGLSAAVLTQVSDVEDETNGILTYDRQVQKLGVDDLKPIFDKISEEFENLYAPFKP